jgi:hypothetical protein
MQINSLLRNVQISYHEILLKMKLIDSLKELVDELDKVHSNQFDWGSELGMPDFVTASNGFQRHFTQSARKSLKRVAQVLHSNRPQGLVQIEIDNYEKIVRQAVANMHAESEFIDFYDDKNKIAIKKLKAEIESRVESGAKVYTHYFPAWTAGIDRKSPFQIGPISFINRDNWIDMVDFPEQGKQQYLNEPEANSKWKEILKDALKNPNDSTPINGLAASVYGAVEKCPSLIKVKISGYEKEFSRKLARLVCKTALDSISLCIGSKALFQQQALQEERLVPVGSYSIVETDGFLWLPGQSLSDRIPHLSGNMIDKAISDISSAIPALAFILEGIVTPQAHRFPKLSNRWATALDWFGEGCRESSDSIAVAKLGTSLDVLSAGGKYAGIASMVSNLLDIDGSSEVIGGENPLTLNKVIKEIYDDGRSKILHGTYFDRLEAMKVERERAFYFARIALIESAFRLSNYNGEDSDNAFRTIPKSKEPVNTDI